MREGGGGFKSPKTPINIMDDLESKVVSHVGIYANNNPLRRYLIPTHRHGQFVNRTKMFF